MSLDNTIRGIDNMNNELNVITVANIMGMELNVYGDIDRPLFLAKDLAWHIEYRSDSISQMLDLVDDEEEKLKGKIYLSGQNREMWFLTEDGVYSILLKSTVDKAKEFRKGFKAFLKAWRKGEIKVVEAVIDDKDKLRLSLFSNDPLTVATAHKALVELEVKPLIEKIEIDKPKVELADYLSKSDNFFDGQKLTKLLNIPKIGRNTLFKILRENNILDTTNQPYQKYMDNGMCDYTTEIYNGELRYKPLFSTKMLDKLYRIIPEIKNLRQ